MGEKSGHPFRGNQFTKSKGGGKGGGKPDREGAVSTMPGLKTLAQREDEKKRNPFEEARKAQIATGRGRAYMNEQIRKNATPSVQAALDDHARRQAEIKANPEKFTKGNPLGQTTIVPRPSGIGVKGRGNPLAPPPKSWAEALKNQQQADLKAGNEAFRAKADRAALREIARRPSLQGFGSGPSENTIRMVKAERKFRADELRKTRASVKQAYQKGVAARKILAKPIRVDKDGEPLPGQRRESSGAITPRDLGGIKQFEAYVKGLRGEPRLKPRG
jgi:hypothetical protein